METISSMKPYIILGTIVVGGLVLGIYHILTALLPKSN